jgi:opacity protein-like surface antigen
MMRISRTLGAMAALAACCVSAVASAQSATNPAGFYLGAGIGPSQIRSDNNYYCCSSYDNYNYQFAWQALLGIRPLHVLGFEAEYIDFGQPGNGYYYVPANSSSHPTAPAIFAVGYLPIPVPFLDIFAKAGGARLSTRISTYAPPPNCPVGAPCTPVYAGREDVTDTKFAYGVGVQSKFPFGLIVRGEYERIASQYGDPDAFMFSAMWTF